VTDVDPPPDSGAALDRLVSLCEPARRELYFFVTDRGGWVSRDEAAAAVGLRRGLVAHHLDRLADDGLLEVEYRRLTGRSGPGAGRPAKLYRRADVELSLSLPPRNPSLVGSLLAEAVSRSGSDADRVRARLLDVAREAGIALGGDGRAATGAGERRDRFLEILGRYGYAPVATPGELSLGNCPYEPLADRDRDLVCSMNLALLEGVVSGARLRGVSCRLRVPVAGGCCVHVGPWPLPAESE
jgi:predicted ArsR family transcriptional regulator